MHPLNTSSYPHPGGDAFGPPCADCPKCGPICPSSAAKTAASLPAPAAGQGEGIRFKTSLRRQLRFKRRYELALAVFALVMAVVSFLGVAYQTAVLAWG